MQDKLAAAKKGSSGKAEAATVPPAEAKKPPPVKATPKTPAVETKQVACHASSLTFLTAYHNQCSAIKHALSSRQVAHSGKLRPGLRNAA